MLTKRWIYWDIYFYPSITFEIDPDNRTDSVLEAIWNSLMIMVFSRSILEPLRYSALEGIWTFLKRQELDESSRINLWGSEKKSELPPFRHNFSLGSQTQQSGFHSGIRRKHPLHHHDKFNCNRSSCHFQI